MAISKREQLLDAAGPRFYANGYHATGIADVLQAAGVSKGTLYQHFDSKEALIEAVLARFEQSSLEKLNSELDRAGANPEARLRFVVRAAHAAWWAGDDFSGCPFTKVAGEYADREHPINRAAAAFKQHIIDLIEDLANRAGAGNPLALATQLALLLDGGAVLQGIVGDAALTDIADGAAQTLVDSALTRE